ncbi:MAG: DUF3592 domain-containing protein [Hyphomonadaceae bacterium]
MGQWLWQWKWAFVIAIFAGPIISYFAYNEGNRLERVLANGAPFQAVVTGGEERTGRRGSRTYTLDVQWANPDGQVQTQTFDISSDYANQIFVGDYVNVETVEVRYLPSETENPFVLVPDARHQIEDERLFQWLGIAAGILGLIVSPLWFWLEGRFKKKREDDIDAELARMRAGQQQS